MPQVMCARNDLSIHDGLNDDLRDRAMKKNLGIDP